MKPELVVRAFESQRCVEDVEMFYLDGIQYDAFTRYWSNGDVQYFIHVRNMPGYIVKHQGQQSMAQLREQTNCSPCVWAPNRGEVMFRGWFE